MSQGNFALALCGLVDTGAPLSGASIERWRGTWHAEHDAWPNRSLNGIETVSLWADWVSVKAGLEQEHAALVVVRAGLRDGRTVVRAVEPGDRESQESWASLRRRLTSRGSQMPTRVIADGHLGI